MRGGEAVAWCASSATAAPTMIDRSSGSASRICGRECASAARRDSLRRARARYRASARGALNRVSVR